MAFHPALCARFHAAVELVGRRWTGAVIQLLMHGRMRYAELRGAIPDISDRMLSERLRELESEGILERLVVPDTPVRVEYELTEKGRALERALAEMGKWAERWGTAEPSRSPSASPPRDSASPRPRRAARSRRARPDRPASA